MNCNKIFYHPSIKNNYIIELLKKKYNLIEITTLDYDIIFPNKSKYIIIEIDSIKTETDFYVILKRIEYYKKQCNKNNIIVYLLILYKKNINLLNTIMLKINYNNIISHYLRILYINLYNNNYNDIINIIEYINNNNYYYLNTKKINKKDFNIKYLLNNMIGNLNKNDLIEFFKHDRNFI